MSTTLVVGPVRFSYLACFEPRAMKDSEEKKYSVTCLIPKKSKKLKAKIEAAIEEEKQNGAEKSWQGKIPKNLKLPLRDGDVDREDDESFHGCWFFTAMSKIKPGVVDADREPILDKNEIYSGAYGYVNITLFSFNTAGNKGIGVSLNHIMKTEDGERLAGGVALESAFDDIDLEKGKKASGLL